MDGVGGDAQRDAQRNDFDGHSPSLAGTVEGGKQSEKSLVEMGLKSLSVTECHEVASKEEWCAVQGLNLRPLQCE